MLQLIVWCSVVSAMLAQSHLEGQTLPKSENAQRPVAADTCLVEVQAPAGATVTVDGRDYKTMRELKFSGLTPAKLYRTQIVVRNTDGRTDERIVWIEGGRRLRINSNKTALERPELVVQSNDFGRLLSNDGKYLLYGGSDGRAELSDVRTGRTLRYYGQAGAGYPKVAFSGDSKAVYATEKATSSDEKVTVVAFDLETGRELRRFSVVDHTELIMSRDGRTLALLTPFTEDAKVHVRVTLYDPQAGQKLTTFSGEAGSDRNATFSPDGKSLAMTYSVDLNGTKHSMLSLWDLSSGKVIKKLGPFLEGYSWTGPEFNLNGSRLVRAFSNTDRTTSLKSTEVVVVDPVAGRQLVRKVLEFTWSGPAFFTRDGDIAINLYRGEHDSRTSSIALFEPDDLQLVREISIDGDDSAGAILELLPDGKTFVSFDGLGSLETGKRIARYERADKFPMYGSLIPLGDFERVAVCAEKGFALWNLRTQQTEMVVDLPDLNYYTWAWRLAAGDKWLHSATRRHIEAPKAGMNEYAAQYVAFDLTHGGTPSRFGGPDLVNPYIVEAAGDRVIVAEEGKHFAWDAARGLRLGALNDRTNTSQYALSTNGQILIGAPSVDEVVFGSGQTPWYSYWSAGDAKSKTVSKATIASTPPFLFALTPDARQLVAFHLVVNDEFTSHYQIEVWDLETDKLVRTLPARFKYASRLTVSPNNKFVALLGGINDGCLIVDLTTGAHIRHFPVQSWSDGQPRFSPDGGRIWLTSNHNLHLWDILTGEKLLELRWVSEPRKQGAKHDSELPFHETYPRFHWLAVTPDGQFDGDAFARNRVAYRVGAGLNVVPVDRFFQDFFRPGLAASVLNGQPPSAEITFARTQAPSVRIISPKSGESSSSTAKLEVEVTDQGGGVAGIGLYHNGARVLAAGSKRSEGKQTFQTFEVALIEGHNQLRVTATNGDGSWDAEPAEITLNYERPITKSDLYVVSIGVSNYADATLNLRFAAADARAIAELFTKRGGRLYERVHATSVIDADATRDGILAAVRKAAKESKPQDTLLVFLAGHGAMVGQRYFFVPHDLRKVAAAVDEDLRKQGVAADELNDEMTAAKALKRVLILDTCASGGAIQLTQLSRSGVALRGAVERLSRASGVFTIAGAAAGEEAKEALELKHGILSYTLLAGLKAVDSGPLEGKAISPGNREGVVDVMEWFSFASGHVPRLTEGLFGISQDVLTSTQGQSFPILPLADTDASDQ